MMCARVFQFFTGTEAPQHADGCKVGVVSGVHIYCRVADVEAFGCFAAEECENFKRTGGIGLERNAVALAEHGGKCFFAKKRLDRLFRCGLRLI